MKPSLVQQLSLAICLFLLIAVGGSFMITLDNSRDQLRLQLGSHSQDAATALGLSLAPHIKDQAMVELMLSAIFDSGHFARISVASLDNGEILAERARDTAEGSAPAWFNRLADIQPEHGSAGIMDGWRQAAEVRVTSHPQSALESLWHSALNILAWLCFCAVVCGLLCTALLKRQLQPLRAIIAQAQAIGRREYRVNPELPSTVELQPITAAMNQMASTIEIWFAEEAARTEGYRHQAYHDPLTGLPNRLALGHALAAATKPGETGGHVLTVQLHGLEKINQQLGAECADALLQSIAAPLKRCQAINPAWLCSRSRGGEFSVLVSGGTVEALQPLMNELSTLAAELLPNAVLGSNPLRLGIAAYQPGDTPQMIMSRVDQALAQPDSWAFASTPSG